MIIFIEGPRHSGKTHLINAYFAQNKNPDVIYYKFQFAKYIDLLGMRDHESGPGVHYFSIANVLTILELNSTLFKDKTIIFDRSIFSAYVWSIYRQRLDRDLLFNEFEKTLNSSLYRDCTLLYFTREFAPSLEKREKDYFGNFENYAAEKEIFDQVFERFPNYTNDPKNRNFFDTFCNRFDPESIDLFCKKLDEIIYRDRKITISPTETVSF